MYRSVCALALLATLAGIKESAAVFGMVECEGTQCPESVGDLAIAGKDEQMSCGGTLVAPDRVLTAGHCVPKELRHEGSSCDGSIRFYQPKSNGKNFQALDCEKIESLNLDDQNPADNPDWALLKLKSASTHRPASVSAERLRVSEDVHGWAVIPTPWMGTDSLRAVNASGINAGYLFALAFADSSPLLFASPTNHAIEPGHSGTGLFDARGDLVAVLTAAFDTSGFVHSGLPNRALVATKIACTPLQHDHAPECAVKSADPASRNMSQMFSILSAMPSPKDPFEKIKDWIAELSAFQSFYPSLDARPGYTFLQNPKFENLRQEFRTEWERKMPRMPTCVHDQGKDSWREDLAFTLISFGDTTRGPGDDGVFTLALNDRLQLAPRTRSIVLDFLVERNGDGFNLSLDEVSNRGLPPDLQASQNGTDELNLCQREQRAREDKCRRNSCTASPRQIATASSQCQELFRNMDWRHALPPATVHLPACVK